MYIYKILHRNIYGFSCKYVYINITFIVLDSTTSQGGVHETSTINRIENIIIGLTHVMKDMKEE